MNLLYEEESYKVRAAFLAVWKSLGSAYKESAYQKALEIEFEKQGLKVERERRIPIYYDGHKIGDYIPDFVVNDKIIVEVKVAPYLVNEHQQQFWRYLKGSQHRLGFLVNFGGKDIEIIRKVYDTARTFCVSPREEVSPRESASKGIMLIMAILVLLVAAIFLPALLFVTRNETIWSVKEKKTTIAFQMAEQGVDRGIWKLQESDAVWNAASSGSVIVGYNFDVVYASTDSVGSKAGEYKIKFTSAPGVYPLQVTVVARGRDKSTDEVREIQAVIQEPAGVPGALQAGEVVSSGSGEIHWGPVLSLTELNLSGVSNRNYPRMFCKTELITSGGCGDKDTNGSADPNTNASPDDCSGYNGQWWSWNHCPGVPDAPVPDREYFKYAAQHGGVDPDGVRIASGGIYYTSGVTLPNVVDTMTYVRFVDGNNQIKFTGGSLVRGYIYTNDVLEFTGGAETVANVNAVTTPPYYPRRVSIPSQAWREYVYGSGGSDSVVGGAGCSPDTSASGEYPGDIGLNNNNPTFDFGSSLTSTSTANPILFEGFGYCGGQFKMTGSGRVVGAILAPNDTGTTSGGKILYYQANLNIRITNKIKILQRKSWREIKATW